MLYSTLYEKEQIMTIDTSFIRKRVEKFEHLYVLFSPYTHLPYIECDDETFDDQIFIFTKEENTQTFAKAYSGRKIQLQALKIPQKMFPSFFTSLHQYGVTAVMLQEEGAPVRVPLLALAEKPDLEKLRNDKVPMANPELQLTGIYFMQELRRQIERDQDEKKHLKELEEEMVHNLFRSRYIVAFDVSQVKGKWNPADRNSKAKQTMLRLKNGQILLPVFSDIGEFRRFAANQKMPQTKMRLVPVPFDKLNAFMPKDAVGMAVNPAGFNLLLLSAQIERLKKLYPPQAE